MTSELHGFARVSTNGGAIKLALDVEAFNNAETYESKNGKQFVGLIINKARLEQVLKGDKDCVVINQIVG